MCYDDHMYCAQCGRHEATCWCFTHHGPDREDQVCWRDAVSRGMSVLTATVECPICETEFQGYWADASMDDEQRDEAPVASQECPHGHKFDAEYPGWSYQSEAG